MWCERNPFSCSLVCLTTQVELYCLRVGTPLPPPPPKKKKKGKGLLFSIDDSLYLRLTEWVCVAF